MSEQAAPLPRRAARDVGAQILGRLLNLVLGIFVTALVARTLGQGAYGQWVTIFAVLGIASEVASLGLTGVAVRQAATEPEREAAWVGALVTVTAAFTVVLVPVTAGVLLLVSDDGDMRVAALVLVSIVGLSAVTATRAVFQLRMRNDVPVAVATLNSVLWAAAVGIVALTDGRLVALAAGFVAVAALTTAIEVVRALRLMPLRLGRTRALWPELLRVGVPLGIGGLLIVAYARIDQVLVFEIAGAEEAGLYGAAYRFLDQAHFLPIAIITTLAPLTAAAAAHDPPRLRRLVNIAARALLIASLGGLAIAAALAEPAMALVFGERFRDAGDALTVLTGAFVVMCLGYLSGNLVLLFGLQRQFVVLASLGLVFNVGMGLIFIPRHGHIAAAWITLATEAVVVLPALTLGLRRMQGGLSPVPLAAAALAAAGLWLALTAGDRSGVPAGVLLGVAAPAYFLLLLLTRAVTRSELAGLRTALARRRGGVTEGSR